MDWRGKRVQEKDWRKQEVVRKKQMRIGEWRGRGGDTQQRRGRGEGREREGTAEIEHTSLATNWLSLVRKKKEPVFGLKMYWLLPLADPVFRLSHIPHLSSPPPILFKYSPFSKWPLLKRRCTYPQPQGVGIDLSKTSTWLHFLPSDWIRHEHMAKFLAKRNKGVETAQMFIN